MTTHLSIAGAAPPVTPLGLPAPGSLRGPLHQVANAALQQGVEQVWLLSPADGRLVVLSATGPPR